MSFAACLPVILASEGGFTETQQDGKIATNLGVTLATWSGWIGRPATIAEIEALTVAAVTPVYLADYYNPAHCPDMPAGVDLMAFDCAVQSGVGRAIRTLQQAVGVTADGAFGPLTASALADCSPSRVIGSFATAREAFYRSLPTFSRFGQGWLNRLSRTKAAALAMAA